MQMGGASKFRPSEMVSDAIVMVGAATNYSERFTQCPKK